MTAELIDVQMQQSRQGGDIRSDCRRRRAHGLQMAQALPSPEVLAAYE